MARIKLSAEDRDRLVERYRQPGVTVASLVAEFGVSNSTVSRILKEAIPKAEYSELVKQKRTGRPATNVSSSVQPSLLDSAPVEAATAEQLSVKRWSDSGEAETEASEAIAPTLSERDELEAVDDEAVDDEAVDDEEVTAEELEAELFDDDDEEDDEFDEDDDEFDEDDDEFDEDEEELDDEEDELDDESEEEPQVRSNRPILKNRWSDEQPDQVEVSGPPLSWHASVAANPDFAPPADREEIDILGLADLAPPKECYAVVDRFHELTTCPLQEFSHLGQVPTELSEAKTLPIFENHRIARRFSDRFRQKGRQKYRVIAFPGYFLEVTRDNLQSKGITHLLLDGQVYAL